MKPRTKAFTLIELLVVVSIIALLVAILVPALARAREQANRVKCGHNIKEIFASLAVYAGNNREKFPQISPGFGTFSLDVLGGNDTVGPTSPLLNLAPDAEDPTGDDGTGLSDYYADGDDRSIESNLWLTVRAKLTETELFRCPSDKGNKFWDFNMADPADGGGTGGAGAEYFINFPWAWANYDPAAGSGTATLSTLSYSFVNPWTVFPNSTNSAEAWAPEMDSRYVIGADQNNGGDPTFVDSVPSALTPKQMRNYINSRNHNGDGQNVLFGDSRVEFRRTAYVGATGDNIYTSRYTVDLLPEDRAIDPPPSEQPGILDVNPEYVELSSGNWDTVLIPVDKRVLTAQGWTTDVVRQ